MTRLGSFRFRNLLFALGVVLYFAGVAVPASAQFETRATRILPGETFGIVTGDFNGDGKLDLAVVDGQLSILPGNGDGTFQAPINYPGVQGLWIAAADFNRDGKLDLVVNIDPDTVSVLLGNGDGTFQAPITSSITTGASFVAVGDFNNDNIPDLAVIDPPYISVLLGKGDGSFRAPSDNDSFVGPQQLAVGDFNNDHKLDVAVVGFFGGTQNFGILLGNGNGTLQNSLSYPLTYTPNSVAAADFNDDGNEDLAIASAGNAVTVLLGNGDGSFKAPTNYFGAGGFLIVGDFNGDAKLDLISGPLLYPGVVEFLGNGDGTFQPGKTYFSGSGGPDIASGDFNGDHKPDVVLLDHVNSAATVMLNTGTLSFSPSSPRRFPTAQLVGTSSPPEIITLTNLGSGPVLIHSILASGSFQASNTCGSEVAAGANCAVSVVFAPRADGVRIGRITLLDNSSSKPQIIELSGRGTFVALSPGTLSFPPQKVGTKSSPQGISITNDGTASLIVSKITIGGADPKDFAVSGTSHRTSQELVPGATCQVSVTFAPKKTGPRNATIFVNDDGPGSPETSSLTGTGT